MAPNQFWKIQSNRLHLDKHTEKSQLAHKIFCALSLWKAILHRGWQQEATVAPHPQAPQPPLFQVFLPKQYMNKLTKCWHSYKCINWDLVQKLDDQYKRIKNPAETPLLILILSRSWRWEKRKLLNSEIVGVNLHPYPGYESEIPSSRSSAGSCCDLGPWHGLHKNLLCLAKIPSSTLKATFCLLPHSALSSVFILHGPQAWQFGFWWLTSGPSAAPTPSTLFPQRRCLYCLNRIYHPSNSSSHCILLMPLPKLPSLSSFQVQK